MPSLDDAGERGSRGSEPERPSYADGLSADGRFLVFESSASNLVSGNGNGTREIFRRDLRAGTTVRVSVAVGGGDPDGPSFDASVSADGRYVAWWGDASDLVPGDTNGQRDVFVRDRALGETLRVSLDSAGHQADGPSQEPRLSADGRYVAFTSYADDLVKGDTGPPSLENSADAFVRVVREPDVTHVVPSQVARGSTTTVVVRGQGFGPGATVTAVPGDGITFGQATDVSAAALTVPVTVSAGAATGTRGVVVSVPGLAPSDVSASIGGCSGCLTVR